MSASEPEFHPDDYGLQAQEVGIHPAELRKLRKEQQRREELERKVAELERRDIFARAGIPIDDPGARYFVKAYDGELTPEAIKAAAIEARILEVPGATPAEVAGHEAAQAAAAGGTPPTVAPDYQARLAELAKKRFAPSDDVGQKQHINDILALAKEAGARIPIYPGS